MADLKNIISTIGADIEHRFDQLKYRLIERLGGNDPVMILPYRGFGNGSRVYLRGRVIEDEMPKVRGDNETLWDNLLATYRRIESDEVPLVRVEADLAGEPQETVADHEGFFEFLLPAEMEPGEELWQTVELRLPDEVRNRRGIRATGEISIPAPDSDFGIISDVDDTIIRTSATDLLTAARLTFLENARTRQPFEGVAAFYRALQLGPSGGKRNPIFYVSSSPWNLYDLLIDFMAHNGIPKGPVLLQDFGLEPGRILHGDHLEHKMGWISRLMEFYPHLQFVLIGDSGQRDPEIYRETVRRFPGRVKGIYIRDVSLEERAVEIRLIADELKRERVEMVLVPDSRAAAEHAAANGLIAPETKPVVEAETERDKRQPEGIVEAMVEGNTQGV